MDKKGLENEKKHGIIKAHERNIFMIDCFINEND